MKSVRDPSFGALIGASAEVSEADFMAVHPDDRAIARASFERALRDGTTYYPEVRIKRSDGTYLWIRTHGRILNDADGRPVALAGVAVDVDERKRASLRAEEERHIKETLYRLGSTFASELDHGRLVRCITEEVTAVVGATSGAFVDPRTGEALATSGDPFDARYRSASLLMVPVVGRSGVEFGRLVLVHDDPGHFTPDHERFTHSIAGQAAIALENARLYRTIREQKEQLESAVERAAVADRRKDEFLAMLGHELRNPLAPIVTALALMERRGGGALQRERDVIARQVTHLARLVDDLLDVSRITRGKVQLSRTVLELGAVLAKAVETVGPMFERRSQRLRVEAPSGLLVDADELRVAQIFQNLLTNASKYSNPHAEITVRAYGDEDVVRVEVIDQGIGISADLRPRIFEMFAQGERALDRSAGGLGLGLTIAKSLCGSMGENSGGQRGARLWKHLHGRASPSAPKVRSPPAPRPSCARSARGPLDADPRRGRQRRRGPHAS